MASDFGTRLKALREAKGLRQRDLASILDVDPMQISRWERGPRTPKDAAELVALAEALDTTTDYLLRGVSVTPVDRPSAAEVRAWPVVAELTAALGAEGPPTDEELVELASLSAFHRGSRGDADVALVYGMRDAIRGMRNAMTPEQAQASAEATARYTDPNVPRRKKR